ncbi:3-hydroxyisobutyrate dehydrogenase [Marinomonas sp. A3A]|uniref:NADPH-dependent F420 reductase n=1 Tax=Marinomonas sp. A3A TaxID=2065312 RepID=UPI001BB3B042|nr:NAD(P)-binding domain-containing protein [Marinomonas sp. A3A]QUX91195.1 3-hydroxyisobutyrate dehydrogenase [Marinomonas sp. A3A]
MKIGIIGTGSIGGTLAKICVEIGHDVNVSNSRGVEGVQSFADEIGAIAVDIYGAVHNADLIILSVPLPAISTLPKNLFEKVPQNVSIIDTSNYYPGLRDPRIPEIDSGQVESLWVSGKLGRPIIKAFNNILAYSLAHLGRAEGALDRLGVAVAGDDVSSKKLVMGLVNEVGFEPVDAGSLAESWRQQPSTPAYCCDWNAAEMKEALLIARKDEAPLKRDTLPEHFGKLGSNPSHSEVIELNRSLNSVD